MIVYPDIDPVIFSIGPVAVHWYGLMYVIGFAAAWWLARRRAADPHSTWQANDVDDLIFYGAIGAVAGGRIGWLLFYGFDQVVAEPSMIIRIWEGGMSFHGGMLGVLLAAVWFAHSRQRNAADIWDFIVPLTGIGLFAGRIGNFINGELWGKPTDVPWAFIVNGVPRHPSQLYEAVLEGLVLFAVLWVFTSRPRPRLAPSGLFLILYGTFRFAVEFVRLPDADIGYLAWGWVTMGQVLSAPMILIGIAMLAWAYRRRLPSGNYRYTAAAAS